MTDGTTPTTDAPADDDARLAAAEPTAPPAPDRPLVLVLHGARGDLARRSVYPALATLHRRGLLPAHWALLGTGREDMPDQEFHDVVAQSLREFGGDDGTDEPDDDVVAALTRHSVFCSESWPTPPAATRGTSSSCTTWPSRRARSSR